MKEIKKKIKKERKIKIEERIDEMKEVGLGQVIEEIVDEVDLMIIIEKMKIIENVILIEGIEVEVEKNMKEIMKKKPTQLILRDLRKAKKVKLMRLFYQ